MNSVNILLSSILFCILVVNTKSREQTKRSVNNNGITDFRYNSGRIDAITRLPNNTLLIVSNGYYWILNDRQTPRPYNVMGQVSKLYSKFKVIDAIFTDPINEVDPKIFIVSHSRKGIRIACQEFDSHFDTHNKFCHLPVDKRWLIALKDLDLKRPIDAATWRNRSKDKDEGFWVFFQGKKMTVIDPYKMDLRFTYDISKWMAINETITATYYDYRTHSFHLFFDNNKYRIWKVNVTLMNSLPMGWDRAFLHGTLSPPMRINRDFFKFHDRELRDYDQPYFEPMDDTYSDDEVEEIEEEEVKEDQEVITEKVDNKIEEKLMENTKQNEFQLIPEISNDLTDINEQNNENKFNVFKNIYQQSDEAAVSPVVANSGPVVNINFIIYYFVLIFYTFL